MSSSLDQWLRHCRAGIWRALSQHTQILKNPLENKTSIEDAANQFINTASSSSDSPETAWRFWNLLFHTAANMPASINSLVDLTLVIYNLPLGPQTPNVLSYHLWACWQDSHSYYYTYRTLATPPSPTNLSGANLWINFTIFSATLVQRSGNDMFLKESGSSAFLDTRDALEYSLESHAKSLLFNSIVTVEQPLQTDTIAAAQ
ncbi:unnamed protein product [Aureobasidium vineae]|uniref:Uncharacterized protein n=1 Tax=Aureobasidium vineae TaxID=2773715 RepID=A0A9N8P7Q0_9PEZI|nr:unnamed protein product [Aureobasidium vineae]